MIIAKSERGALAGLRILVVEDEYLVAEELTRTLRLTGAEVIGAAPTVGKALALIKSSERIDAAVIDINLAGEQAYPVVDALIALKRPFIFSTVYRSDELPEQYQEALRCSKPLQPPMLLRQLRQALGDLADQPDVAAPGPAPDDEISQWLLTIAQDRNKVAFRGLFELIAPKLKGVLLRRGATPAAAEDLVQEVMLTIWWKADQFDASRSNGWGWIFMIARNLQIDAFRRERNPGDLARQLFAHTDPVTPEEALAEKFSSDRVHRALDSMPVQQANLLRQSYIQDVPHAEIARSNGWPLGTVKSRLKSAVAKLRTMLEN